MAINKGIQEGLEAGIEHRKVGRSLAEVEAYDSGVGAAYVAACGGSRDPDSISHEILLSDTLATSHDRAARRRMANVDDTVPSSEPHDDLFDATVLDKPVDSYFF
nr:hypothetical protein [Tanacetum cinerariifolium]